VHVCGAVLRAQKIDADTDVVLILKPSVGDALARTMHELRGFLSNSMRRSLSG
jgi:hypothetical protein